MKKLLLAILVVFFLLSSVSPAFARRSGKGGRVRDRFKDEQLEKIEKEDKENKEKSKSEKKEDKKKDKKEKKESKDKAKDKDEAKDKAKDEDKEKGEQKGKDHQQQLKALEKKMRQERMIHEWQMKRLQKQLDQAKAGGDDKAVERLEGILAKRQSLYDRKTQQLQEKRQKILELIEKEKGSKAKGSDKNKGRDEKGEKAKDKDKSKGKKNK